MAAGLGIVAILIYLLLLLTGIASLVCFALVVVQMFKNDQNGLGIACIILAFCTGIGPLIAFVFGWIKVQEWNLKNVMLAWTGMMILQVFLGIGLMIFVVGAAASAAGDMDFEEFNNIEFPIDGAEMQFDIEMREGIEFEEAPVSEPETESVPPAPE